MHTRTRTALVTLTLNAVLTALKFAAFVLTGSLAILAEAWHSFGDIVTSTTALLAVRRQASRDAARLGAAGAPDGQEPEEGAAADGTPEEEAPRGGGASSAVRGPVRWWRRARAGLRWAWNVQPEHKAAFAIALFLAGVGVVVLRKVLTASPSPVERPLEAGVAFLAFSLASYGVSRFELGVGRAEGSAALVADGMHARADAVATLLTGLSLIAYRLGFDVDRPVAGFLGLIILSFAIETLVNLVADARRGRAEFALRHRTSDLLAALLDPRTVARAVGRLLRRLDTGGALGRGLGRALRATPWVAALLVAGAYGSTFLVCVGPEEEVIIQCFGRVTDPRHSAQPGLHLKPPWPVGRAVRIPSRRLQELAVGNVTSDTAIPMIWTRAHGTGQVFVSGDNNFLFPFVVVHYRVASAYDYHYGVADPERLIEDVSLRALTHEVACREFYDAALGGRADLARDLRLAIQRSLDDLGAGVEVVDVLVKDVHPPRDVARSFEDVVAAQQDYQTRINGAEGYRNAQIPQARADALRQIEEARAYVADTRTRSEGEAARFILRRAAYATSRRVTRQRLYIDAMTRALQGRRKVIVSPDAGRPDLWLDRSVSTPPRTRKKRGAGTSDTSGRSTR